MGLWVLRELKEGPTFRVILSDHGAEACLSIVHLHYTNIDKLSILPQPSPLRAYEYLCLPR